MEKKRRTWKEIHLSPARIGFIGQQMKYCRPCLELYEIKKSILKHNFKGRFSILPTAAGVKINLFLMSIAPTAQCRNEMVTGIRFYYITCLIVGLQH